MKPWKQKLLFTIWLLGCGSTQDGTSFFRGPDVPEETSASRKDEDGAVRTVVLFLPGLDPETSCGLKSHANIQSFHPGESTVAGAFVQLMSGSMLHRLFAERLMEAGQVVSASAVPPGILLQAAEPAAVWAPGIGSGHGMKGLVRMLPSRATRVRTEVVGFTGEGEFRVEKSGAFRRYSVRPFGDGKSVRISVQGPVRRLYHSQNADLAEAKDTLEFSLSDNDVTTLFFEDPEGDFAVSVGVKKIQSNRLVWHREGPVPDGLFPPPDLISLRMRELSVQMQSGFITGALRSQFLHARNRMAGLSVMYVPAMLDLSVSLSLAPGSWDGPLRSRMMEELRGAMLQLQSEGVRTIPVGLYPLVPVQETLDRRCLETLPADHVITGHSSVLFLWNDPDTSSLLHLEAELTERGFHAMDMFLLSSVPGGLRLDFPPGVAVGRCREKQCRCNPVDDSGQLVSSPFLKAWFSLPLEKYGTFASGLFDLIPAISWIRH